MNIEKLTCNNEFTSPSYICNDLNNYFCSVGSTLAESLSLSHHPDFKLHCSHPCKNSMFCHPVTIPEIMQY